MVKQVKADLEVITAEYAGWNDVMQKTWMLSYNRIISQLNLIEATVARMSGELGYSQTQILEAFDMKPSQLKEILGESEQHDKSL